MDNNTLLLLDFGDSTFAYLSATFSVNLGCPLNISGSKGAARVLDRWSRLEIVSTEGRKIEELSYDGTLPYVEQLGLSHTHVNLHLRKGKTSEKPWFGITSRKDSCLQRCNAPRLLYTE